MSTKSIIFKKQTMKKTLYLSIFINILLVIFWGYDLYKKGGIEYLKDKFGFNETSESEFGVYYDAKMQFFENVPKDTNEVIFIGDSITEGCDWAELFGNHKLKNRGISNDDVAGVINRIQSIVESKPKKIFIMIGINDLARGKSIHQILKDYERLISLITNKMPDTEIYIQSILPTKYQETRKNGDIMKINTGLNQLSIKYNLIFINLFDSFRDEKNELNLTYSFDGLHLNGNGYFLWKKLISNYVNK
jgi:lysophospholipase L1-like esterase